MTLEERTKNLQDYVKEELPDVSKMKRQLTDEDCHKLFEFADSKEILEVLMNMENTVGIERKYKSVYLTVRNWIKIQRQSAKSKMTGGKGNVIQEFYTYEEALGLCKQRGWSTDLHQNFKIIPAKEEGKKPLWQLKS